NSGDFGETNNCPSSPMAPGSSCTITVTFTPTSAGTRTASVSITDDGSGSPQTARLTGTGTTSTGGGSGPAFVQVQNNIDTSSTTYYSSLSVNITTNPGDLLVAFVRESSNG